MIPVCKPDLTEEDAQAVAECVRDGWVSGISPKITEFEQAFANYVGAKHAVAVNSGTSALQTALAAYGIGRGDEVIIPDFTMIASANACRYLGAKPVFVDCEWDTWNIDPALIEQKITAKTKAVMPVHIYGHPAAMDAIINIAQYHNLTVIDDAAEALGAEFCGHKVGCFTDATCFSFYANKTITTGEGGLITTSNAEVAEKMRWLKAHCFGRGGRHFYHEQLGYGFRMSGLQAALGLSQLKRADSYVEARRRCARAYMDILKPLEQQGKLVFPVEKSYAKNLYWMFTVLVNGKPRNQVIAELAKHGVDSRPTFTPLHKQPIYRQRMRYPWSEHAGMKGINLPSSNTLTDMEIHTVCEELKRCLN